MLVWCFGQDLDKFLCARSPDASQISIIEVKVVGDQTTKAKANIEVGVLELLKYSNRNVLIFNSCSHAQKFK